MTQILIIEPDPELVEIFEDAIHEIAPSAICSHVIDIASLSAKSGTDIIFRNSQSLLAINESQITDVQIVQYSTGIVEEIKNATGNIAFRLNKPVSVSALKDILSGYLFEK